MTTHPDSPEPCAGAPTPEPMSEERIAELRAIAESFWSQTTDSALASQCDATIQCLDEIERLKSITFEHPCICDLYGDADANYISRITRLRETNRTLGETNERQRAVIVERDAEIARLEIDNSRLCEELNTIEIEVPDVE